MLKFYCDKCEIEINQKEGAGTFVFVSKESLFDTKSKQIIPRLKQEEFQLCMKHSKEIFEFIKNKNKNLK